MCLLANWCILPVRLRQKGAVLIRNVQSRVPPDAQQLVPSTRPSAPEGQPGPGKNSAACPHAEPLGPCGHD